MMHTVPPFPLDPRANQFRELCRSCGYIRTAFVIQRTTKPRSSTESGARSAAPPPTRTACPGVNVQGQPSHLGAIAGSSVPCFRRRDWPDGDRGRFPMRADRTSACPPPSSAASVTYAGASARSSRPTRPGSRAAHRDHLLRRPGVPALLPGLLQRGGLPHPVAPETRLNNRSRLSLRHFIVSTDCLYRCGPLVSVREPPVSNTGRWANPSL